MADPSGVLDDALELLCDTGPEFGPGLSNHGPMAAEALFTLGRSDDILPWVEGYKRRLQEPASPRSPISESSWQEALGDVGRVADWSEFFHRELAERPWPEVVNAWSARLAPGIISAATHGVIRTAHAVRNLERTETQERRRELADGLAYWAARYMILPGSPSTGSTLLPSEALTRVQPLPADEQQGGGLITRRLGRLGDNFSEVVNLVDTGSDHEAFLADMTATFARVYLANVTNANVIGLIHAVTGPSSLRLLLPHLKPNVAATACAYAWQAGAALYAVFGQQATSDSVSSRQVDHEDVIDRAVATTDEHAIKFTEACLREHNLHADDVFLAAAIDASTRLRRRA